MRSFVFLGSGLKIIETCANKRGKNVMAPKTAINQVKKVGFIMGLRFE
jgi:hypothetical protein